MVISFTPKGITQRFKEWTVKIGLNMQRIPQSTPLIGLQVDHKGGGDKANAGRDMSYTRGHYC